MTDTEKSHRDFHVTRDLFLEWRSPRYGALNPTVMNNHVWEWLIETGISAYQATEEMGGPSPCEAGPTWCFNRYGQSSTRMPDGSEIYIGGEHEDFYDPDFYIYNDVVVKDGSGNIFIYGYSKDCFPPTDFHSATLVGNKIVVIGNLGYDDQRLQHTKRVFVLNTETYEISQRDTSGDFPGWIHGHSALLDPHEDLIKISGGKIDRGEGRTLIENIDDWQLDLTSWAWRRLTQRKWSRWEINRADKQQNHLWEIRQALWSLEVNWLDDYQKSIEMLRDELGCEPDVKIVKDIYRPDVHHESVPEVEEEYETHRIIVDGVIVRYVEDRHGVQMAVEGELPKDIIKKLVEDVRTKLSILENSVCDVEEIS